MRNWRWFLLSFMVIVLDQLTKIIVSLSMAPYQIKTILPILNMTLVYNTGVAFGVLQGHSSWLAVLSFVMSVFLAVWIARLKSTTILQLLGLSLILGGALGNFIDRAFLGYVIDFIAFHIQHYHFAVFNVADSAISVGVMLLLWDGLKNSTDTEESH